MKKYNRIAEAAVVMLMMMLTIGLTSPAVLAINESDGTATATNVIPEVTVATAPSVTPEAECNFSCTVSDANTLEDIDNLVLIVYLTSVTEEADDDAANHYTFKYTVDAPSTWEEIGPDTEGSHISDGTEPGDLTVLADDYVFKITLAGVATPGTDAWTAKWIATDDNNESGYKEDIFTVSEYISLSIDTETLTFTGEPGDPDLPSSPTHTTCTVTSNYIFDIEVKLSADWIGTTHSGAIPMGNTDAARDAEKTVIIALSGEYLPIWEDVAAGDPVLNDIYWFLELPSPLRDDVYTTTFNVQVAKVV